ncbi:MAG: T9SS type A sorting domain-containing protein [Ignavibacteriae bacterium]|nr:T9SS type A sorting domain-containing protein [Ignavibacteriota bacterium]
MKALYCCILVACVSSVVIAQTEFWVHTSGPYGGRINALIVDAHGHAFAGTTGAGIFASYNDGASWKCVTTNPSELSVYSLAVDQRGDVFAATLGRGVIRSTDDGATWTRVDSGWVSDLAWAVMVDPAGWLYTSEGLGLYRSTNHGNSWTRQGDFPYPPRGLAANATGRIFAATYYYGALRSTNAGQTWEQINNGIGAPAYLNAMATTSEGYVFAALNGDGVFRTTDNGDHWVRLYPSYMSAYSLHVNSDSLIFAGCHDGVYRSSDAGSSWYNMGAFGAQVLSMAGTKGGSIFLGTNFRGVYRSMDTGLSWNRSSHGLANSTVVALAIDSSGRLYAAPEGDHVQFSTDNGETWTLTQMGVARPFVQSLTVDPSGIVYAGTLISFPSTGGVFRSTDHGQNWASAGLAGLDIDALCAKQDGVVYAGVSGGIGIDGIYVSTNRGDLWERVDTVVGVNEIDLTPDGIIFAATRDGIRRSTNSGGTWSWVNNGLQSGFVGSVRCRRDDEIFAGMSGGVYSSSDLGESWHSVGLQSIGARNIAVNSLGHIFVSSTGIYRSTDRGASWAQVNTGLTHREVRSLAIDSSGTLFAGTMNGGVFRSRYPTMSVGDRQKWTPGDFLLWQNYPNPFNPTTRIKYQIPNLKPQTTVTLKVFDILGREVATLVNEVNEPGTHTVQWDASGFSSGVYFYRLRSETFVQTRKLMIVK